MKKPSRFLRVLGAAGLLISLLAVTITPVAAQDEAGQDFLDYLVEVENAGFLTGNNTIFYPWVANDDNFGLGDADTSISIQNLEDQDTVISIFVGNANGGFDLVTAAYLAAYASKTFSAADLGIASGDGAPVLVASFNEITLTGFPVEAGVPEEAITTAPAGTVALVETPVILSNPVADDEADGENDGGDTTQVIVCVVNSHSAGQPGLGNAHGYVDAATGNWVSYSTQAELQETLNAANAGNTGELINPFAGLNNDGDCFDVLEVETLTLDDSVAIGGIALQTAEAAAPGNGDDDDDDNGENGENGNDDGAELEQFTTTHTSVSGYNAVNGVEVAYFDEWYLPIVQTNGGPGGVWNSIIRVANYDALNNAVTVRFFPADDGSGSLQTGFQVQALVNGGDTWNIDLGELVPEGWVGSAHIYSDGAVFAMVDRYKVGTGMWITNTGSSADFENLAQVDNAQNRYALFAPHVLLDWFGWNTGINVANLVTTDNNVSIQYFNLLGNATQVLNQRLAPHGMTYFYDPSIAAQDNNQQDVTTDPNAGIVGSAVIWSDYPVAAVVDATKYAETDPNGGADVGQATSYSATANVFPWQAVPYVTKGNPIDGSGATSGINIMNPNNVAATANVYYVNPSGFNAQNFGTSSVTIPAFANGFVYTLWQHNLPNGFLGAAQVVANVPVAAVSANVNYDVEQDGSAIFNAFNPCGLYRVAGACSFGDVLEPGGQSVTKTFVDEFGDPVSGVNFSIASTSGAVYQRDGVSGVDGSAIFTNVPVGVYDLTVNDVPANYIPLEGVQETFVVEEGEDVVLVNTLEWNSGFLKTVCVADTGIADWLDGDGGFDDFPDFDEEGLINILPTIGCATQGEGDDATAVGVAGINVAVFEVIGDDFLGAPVIGTEPVFEGVTGADGTIGGALPAGEYILCIYDEDGDGFLGSGVTSNGEEVDVLIPDDIYASALCAGELLNTLEWELFGDLFEVEVDDVTELENPLFVVAGELNIAVSAAELGGTGATLADHGGDHEPVADVQVCIDADFTDYYECRISDANGNVHFDDAPWGVYYLTVNYTGEDDAEQNFVLSCAIGGEQTTEVYVLECGSLDDDSYVVFGYSPTEDIAQDGYSADDNRGTADLEVFGTIEAGEEDEEGPQIF